MAIRLRQYLNTKFEICSLIKTGARANQFVLSLENELESLGKSDAVVTGRTNDTDVANVKVNDILAPMIHFVQKYVNTNVIIVNIPHRHDLENVADVDKAKVDKTNSIILKTILRAFKNTSLVELSTSRNHFTKHGLHLNKLGKEMIAKHIATQINQISEIATKSESAVTLQWKKEIIGVQDGTGEGMIQIHHAQINKTIMINNETTHRTSTRNKKVPATMFKEFLW